VQGSTPRNDSPFGCGWKPRYGEDGLSQDSKVLTEQIRAMDKQRLTAKIGSLSERFIRLIERAIRNSLDM